MLGPTYVPDLRVSLTYSLPECHLGPSSVRVNGICSWYCRLWLHFVVSLLLFAIASSF